MKGIYGAVIWLVSGILPLGAVFSPKLKHFLQGREALFSNLKKFKAKNPTRVTWVHAASLGEYEMAKPILAEIKQIEPKQPVVVSFFSPSGYDPSMKKNQPGVDFITYLPLDRQKWANDFVNILDPGLAIFIKYDLWFFHLEALKKRSIPCFLTSANFRKGQVYFGSFGGFFRKNLEVMDWIFTQNEESVDLLNQYLIHQASRGGDTRFDRVAAHAAQPKSFPDLAAWIGVKPVVVVGSAWEEDMNLLIPLMNQRPDYRWIVAPHDLSPEPMDRWAKQLMLKSAKYSQWSPHQAPQVLFIDNIGMLSSLYQFARIAYVGGAFGKGLHNILEPLGFGVPVLFGKVKKASKFPEAEESEKQGCGFSVTGPEDLREIFQRLQVSDFHQKAQDAAQSWVASNQGAAKKIVSKIKELIQP
ncbi:3-deoxy-D-manno-octulosonic acid transferase [Algoriphagus confluentis]|uniref:3-deoxy-D-manno-octulosonic acid transferase n=1 Tax=Algoriphagus confluentis TaxID=1697556 RepID=A0ABQ6PTD3_9BACT|nr:glycosyltransferase N-terminal domain-containing protein [Algoriphagus confluentis]